MRLSRWGHIDPEREEKRSSRSVKSYEYRHYAIREVRTAAFAQIDPRIGTHAELQSSL